jgi:hypothetical protein
MTTDHLPNAIAFTLATEHEGDPRTILHQAKAACRTLLRELQTTTADRDEQAVQNGELRAELERLRACLRHEQAECETLRRQLDDPLAPWNNA